MQQSGHESWRYIANSDEYEQIFAITFNMKKTNLTYSYDDRGVISMG